LAIIIDYAIDTPLLAITLPLPLVITLHRLLAVIAIDWPAFITPLNIDILFSFIGC
jgi:hypothetical protein